MIRNSTLNFFCNTKTCKVKFFKGTEIVPYKEKIITPVQVECFRSMEGVCHLFLVFSTKVKMPEAIELCKSYNRWIKVV